MSVKDWDWSLAEAGFAGHRKGFARALVAETERLGLNGVDVDLEGNGEYDKSKKAFTAFIARTRAATARAGTATHGG